MDEYAFDIACEFVSMKDVISFYSFHVDKNKGRCRCPFHNGNKYNFSYNEHLYQCFVCGARGNIITFVSEYYGVSKYEALKKIDYDFHLGLTEDKGKETYKRYQVKQESRNKELEYLNELNKQYITYTKLFHLMNDLIERYRPKSDSEELNEAFLNAITIRSNTEMIIDNLWLEITSRKG